MISSLSYSDKSETVKLVMSDDSIIAVSLLPMFFYNLKIE